MTGMSRMTSTAIVAICPVIHGACVRVHPVRIIGNVISTGRNKPCHGQNATSIVDKINKDDFSEREDLEIMAIMDILNNYGEGILKAVGYEGCRRWYGPIFDTWYNQTHAAQ